MGCFGGGFTLGGLHGGADADAGCGGGFLKHVARVRGGDDESCSLMPSVWVEKVCEVVVVSGE